MQHEVGRCTTCGVDLDEEHIQHEDKCIPCLEQEMLINPFNLLECMSCSLKYIQDYIEESDNKIERVADPLLYYLWELKDSATSLEAYLKNLTL